LPATNVQAYLACSSAMKCFCKIATIGQCDQTVLFIDDAPVKEGFTLASLLSLS
jgi:hypothetical protein